MLVKFEKRFIFDVVNECFLEIEIDEKELTYEYTLYDKDGNLKDMETSHCQDIDDMKDDIWFILNYCYPQKIMNKLIYEEFDIHRYELLPYETMEDYLDYLEHGDDDGDWCLERQGTDYEDIKYYKTEEDAKAAMIKEVSSEDYEDYEPDIDYPCCEASGEEYYQKWTVYKKPTYKTETERILNEIQLEIDRTYNGISQYAWELQDSYVIEKHLTKVEKLVNKLKEMI